jgi:hypothetical protein
VLSIALLLVLAGESGVFGGNGISVVNNGDEARTWAASSYVPSTLSPLGGGTYVLDALSKTTGAAERSPSAGVASQVTDGSSRLLLKLVSLNLSRPTVHVSDLVAAEVVALGLVLLVAYRRRVAHLQVLVLAVVVLPVFSRWLNSLYSDGPALAGTAALLIAWLGTRDDAASAPRRVATWGAMALAIGFVAFSNVSFVAIAVVGVVAQVVTLALAVRSRARARERSGSAAAFAELLARSALVVLSVVLVVLSVGIETRSSLLQTMAHTTYSTDFLTTIAIPLLGVSLVSTYGMPHQLLQMKGISYWQVPTRWGHIPGWESFVSGHVSAVRLDLLRNPIMDARLLGQSLVASTSPSIAYLGNGTGGASGHDVSLWSRAVDLWWLGGEAVARLVMIPFTSGALGVVTVVVMIVGVVMMARDRLRGESSRVHLLEADEGLVIWCVVAACVSCLMSVFGDGTAGLGRHNLVASYCLMIAVISFVLAGLKWRGLSLAASTDRSFAVEESTADSGSQKVGTNAAI